jgi:hypothetical protein
LLQLAVHAKYVFTTQKKNDVGHELPPEERGERRTGQDGRGRKRWELDEEEKQTTAAQLDATPHVTKVLRLKQRDRYHWIPARENQRHTPYAMTFQRERTREREGSK